jgi:hypothetical protein
MWGGVATPCLPLLSKVRPGDLPKQTPPAAPGEADPESEPEPADPSAPPEPELEPV